MSSILVKNLALNYPFYGQRGQGLRSATSPLADSTEPGRLLISKAGRVIGVRALQNISFEAHDGDRVALIGDNGSGKTTLLQVLAGIYTPDAGSVEVDGNSTAIVNINLGMNEEASGHRNITLRGLASGYSLAEIEARREEIAAFSELGEFLNLPVQAYSSGMRMRLTFAIATSFNPDILILDEWLSAGDAAFREKATRRMASFVDKAGILVLASHSSQLLKNVCNRALWLDHGRLRAAGDIDEIITAYHTESERKRLERASEEARSQVEIARAEETSRHHTQSSKPLNQQRRLVPDGTEPDLEQPLARLMRWAVRKLLGRV